MAEAVLATDRQDRWRALAVLVLGACIIGLSPILVRLTTTGPAAAGVWRLAVALPLLALMARRADGLLQPPPRIALWGGLAFAFDLGFWHYGIKYTSVTNATVLSNLTPVVVTFFAWAVLKQRPRPLFLLAVAIAVAGSWTMALDKGGGPGLNPPLGDVLSVATALFYALYLLAIGEGRRSASASLLMFWSSAVSAPLLLAAALLLKEPLLPSTLAGLAACIGLGLMHVSGQGAIAWSMGRLPTATASVVILIQPVVAAWLGYVMFGEAIGPMQATGAAVALCGIVLAQWASRAKAPA